MWFSETIGAAACAMSTSYPERRATAISEFITALTGQLAERILAKAKCGKTRLIVHFERTYATNLIDIPELEADLNEEEQALLSQRIHDWCGANGLTATISKHNPGKVTFTWCVSH